MRVLEINACGVSVSHHRSYPAVLRNCHGSRFHSCGFTFVLVTRAITSFYRPWTSTTRTITAAQVSRWNLPVSEHSVSHVSVLKLRESHTEVLLKTVHLIVHIVHKIETERARNTTEQSLKHCIMYITYELIVKKY